LLPKFDTTYSSHRHHGRTHTGSCVARKARGQRSLLTKRVAMAGLGESIQERISSLAVRSSSTVVPPSARHCSAFNLTQKHNQKEPSGDAGLHVERNWETSDNRTSFERSLDEASNETYQKMSPTNRKPFIYRLETLFSKNGKLRPFRLLRQDIRNIKKRYLSDWTLFNQLVFASALYVFFTNILPGITFASDLYVLTGMTWGTIEVVFSTGLCGIIFAL
jgi:hypothetical protein